MGTEGEQLRRTATYQHNYRQLNSYWVGGCKSLCCTTVELGLRNLLNAQLQTFALAIDTTILGEVFHRKPFPPPLVWAWRQGWFTPGWKHGSQLSGNLPGVCRHLTILTSVRSLAYAHRQQRSD